LKARIAKKQYGPFLLGEVGKVTYYLCEASLPAVRSSDTASLHIHASLVGIEDARAW
jgi:hypothetical protein